MWLLWIKPSLWPVYLCDKKSHLTFSLLTTLLWSISLFYRWRQELYSLPRGNYFPIHQCFSFPWLHYISSSPFCVFSLLNFYSFNSLWKRPNLHGCEWRKKQNSSCTKAISNSKWFQPDSNPPWEDLRRFLGMTQQSRCMTVFIYFNASLRQNGFNWRPADKKHPVNFNYNRLFIRFQSVKETLFNGALTPTLRYL